VTIVARRSKTAKVRIAMTIHALWPTANQCLLSLGTMAPFARNFIVYTLNPKCPKIMLLPHINSPTVHGVATRTICAFLALVNIDMTGFTCLRRAPIFIGNMTLATLCLAMKPFQRIICLFLMFKAYDWRPGRRCVACLACSFKLPVMEVVVTIRARRINGFIVPIFVTRLTGHKLMSTGELKATFRVIEDRNLPEFKCFMTVITARVLKLSTMYIRVAITAFTLGVVF